MKTTNATTPKNYVKSMLTLSGMPNATVTYSQNSTPMTPTTPRHTKADPMSFHLSGTSGCGARTFNTSQRDAPVTLIREPFNTYDSKAIAVYLDGVKIGYVPRPVNQFVWFLIDSQSEWQVTDWDLDTQPEYPLIQVTLTRS